MDDGERLATLYEGLRRLVASSTRSQAAIERALGYSPKYLSKILNRRLQLRAEHLLELLQELGAAPGPFFESCFPQEDPETSGGVVGSERPLLSERTVRVLVDRIEELERQLSVTKEALEGAEADITKQEFLIVEEALSLFASIMEGESEAVRERISARLEAHLKERREPGARAEAAEGH